MKSQHHNYLDLALIKREQCNLKVIVILNNKGSE